MTDVIEAGIRVKGRIYPAPRSYSMNDSVLVWRLTGMKLREFGEAIDQLNEEIMLLAETGDADAVEMDPSLLLGLAAVAVWQGNRSWELQRIIRYMMNIDLADIEFVGPDGEEEDRETNPPTGSVESEPSSTSSKKPKQSQTTSSKKGPSD